jgi:hypothetical protein
MPLLYLRVVCHSGTSNDQLASPPLRRPPRPPAMEPALAFHTAALTGTHGRPAHQLGAVIPSKIAMPSATTALGFVEIPGRLSGGAPKGGANHGRTFYPYVRQRGLLRIEVATHFPTTAPVFTDTFDADLSLVPRDDPCWDSKYAFIRYMQYLIFRKLCSEHRVRFGGPAPVGRFDPPIGSRAFFREVHERGVSCQYCVCWPVVPVLVLTPRPQSPTLARLPAPSVFSSSSSRSSSPRSPSCSSTRAPASMPGSEPQPSSPSPTTPGPRP